MTKKDLESEVARLNQKYCTKTKNHLVISGAYGGYRVDLTGKRDARNPKKYRGLGTGVADMTPGYQSATKTLGELHKADSKGWLKNRIKHYEGRK